MDDNEEKLKAVDILSLFEERARWVQAYTDSLFEAIRPTALEALTVVFNTPFESISWLDITLVENVVVISAIVSYDDDAAIPEIIEKVSTDVQGLPQGEKAIRLYRLVRVGIPVELILEPKENIIGFFQRGVVKHSPLDIVDEQPSPVPQDAPVVQENGDLKPTDDTLIVTPTEEQFDMKSLSEEQLQQLLFFQQMTRGTKH